MSRTVRVNLQERSYDIHIGIGLPVGRVLAGEKGCRALVVTDAHVAAFHGSRVEKALREQGLEVTPAVVPAGELTKDLQMVEELYAKALSVGFDRRSVIVALGGGVVGDLAGFVAGTLLRGVRFIQVPTTLLAMVDSSVGGKTGVNLPQGKNLVGVFHQPVEVVADLDTLKTLPEREYLSGLAEVIKYGVIRDAAFFERLEARLDRLRARDADELEEVVARCCEIKAAVVSSDERETGERAILNFGHTLAHALENVGGYSRWLHGEAVAIGMAFAARLSEQQAGLPAADRQRIEAMLAALRLPVRVDQMAWEAVRHAMQLDKKVWRRLPRFALAERLGHAVFGREVPEEILIQTFKDICG